MKILHRINEMSATDLTREYLKHLCVGGRFVSADCRDGELQKQAWQALRGILLIGRLGSLPAHVTIRQTNQHHLRHTEHFQIDLLS